MTACVQEAVPSSARKNSCQRPDHVGSPTPCHWQVQGHLVEMVFQRDQMRLESEQGELTISRGPASHARKAPRCMEEALYLLELQGLFPARKQGDELPFWERGFLDGHILLLSVGHAGGKWKGGVSGEPVPGIVRSPGAAEDRALDSTIRPLPGPGLICTWSYEWVACGSSPGPQSSPASQPHRSPLATPQTQ